jgi:hypothetical protein
MVSAGEIASGYSGVVVQGLMAGYCSGQRGRGEKANPVPAKGAAKG